MVVAFRRELLLSLGNRTWHLGQSLLILALPVLMVLKLTGAIAWSWWWVLAPLWISGIIVFLFLCLLGAGILRHRRSRRLAGDYQDGEYGERVRAAAGRGKWNWEDSVDREHSADVDGPV